ncbi:MAG: sigma-70 family RNA polymerase sigma factor [Planctomycetes bacterium]|nr:sigma-70 family RNA polymerase sigma factor [Planctomycetota bacterium]
MRTAKLSGLVNRFGHDTPRDPPTVTDADLLERFVAAHDEPAFAELVRRYGPLVFAVCRRVAGDHHLAEDAFQAVFVVLATKAATVRPTALPGWFHRVACNTALRARTMNDRRRRRETPTGHAPEPATAAPESADDLPAIIDEEIARLPDALRAAVVLCELEGCPRKAAAERLGVPEGTVSSRLAAARRALAARLRKRGVALGAAALAAALARQTTAGVPANLTRRTVAAATSPAPAASAVAVLSNGVLRLMFAQKLKVAVPVVALALGALAFALAGSPPPEAPAPKSPAVAFRVPPEVAPPPRFAARRPPKGPNRILLRRDNGLFWLDPDGKNEKELHGKKSDFQVSGAQLSPDGTRYAARVHKRQNPDDEPTASLYVRALDEKEPGTDLGTAPDLYVWSRDGTEIACTEIAEETPERSSDAAHYILNVRTKEKTPLKIPSDHLITGWSPDGKLFLTLQMNDKPAPFARLCLMNRDGSEHKVLTHEKRYTICGRLSPDGTHALCADMPLPTPEKGKKAPRLDLSVIDVTTGKTTEVRDVPLNADLLDFCWSPDGKQIAYMWRQRREGQNKEEVFKLETESHLIVCDPDGRNQKTVLSAKGTGYGVTLSELDWR